MDPKTLLKKVLTDFGILSAVALPILIFRLFGTPSTRGFFCNDETISYPFKDSTVPNFALYIVGLGLPITVMCITEVILSRNSQEPLTPMYIMERRIPIWLVNCYEIVGVFCFGAVCSQLITDVAKYTIGRLRPHFFDVCNPDVDCTLQENHYRYITDYKCRGLSSKHLREARLSFPSGHSSFSAYTMIFLVCYLQSRVHWKGSFLLKHVAQLCCVLISWSTALSRINDNKHHWSDVTVGLIIGSIVAVVTFLFTCKEEIRRIKTRYLKESMYLLADVRNTRVTDREVSSIRSRLNRDRYSSSVMWA